MNNRNLVLLFLISAVIGSAGLFYWLNRDFCRAFSKKNVEITCEEAQDLALQAYPGKIESITLGEGLLSARGISTQPHWLVGILLDDPVSVEKLNKDVLRIIVKVTMERSVGIYEIVK